MILHCIRITVIVVLLVSCIFLPFAPGEYDAFSTTLSTTAQLISMAALLTLPVGISWLIYGLIRRLKKETRSSKATYRFAVASLVASGLVFLVAPLGALVHEQRSLAIIILLICIYVVVRIISRLKRLNENGSSDFNPMPLYFVIIPVVVVLIRFNFIADAEAFSRKHAIMQSERLIRDIEEFHSKNGHYPISLLALHPDYKTNIIGISQYRYESFGNSYNLCFEQFSGQFGAKEIVMYNKLDEHTMTSHDEDLLKFSGEELNIQRGFFAVHDLETPHWKYFLFD